MNKIYEMLNGAEVNLNEYEAYKLSDAEKQNLKKDMRKKVKKNSFFIRNKFAAAAVVLIVALISTFMGDDVLAKIYLIGTSIEEFFSGSNSLADYKTVVDSEVTVNGVTVKLSEVLMDDSQIIVSSTFNTDKIKWDESAYVDQDIYINGKSITDGGWAGSSRAQLINDTTCGIITSVNPDNKIIESLAGDANIKVVYTKIRTRDGELNGKWIFEFKANRDMLSAKIKEIPVNRKIPLDKAFTVENGAGLTIENIVISPASLKLNYIQPELRGCHITYTVKDQNGKEINWKSGHSFDDVGSHMYEALDEEVTKLIITPVINAVSLPLEGNGEEAADFIKILDDQSFEVIIP